MEKIFFGSVKELTNQYGTMFSIGIKKEDLDKLEFNEKGYCNLSLKKSQKGSWYMEVYIPENRASDGLLETKAPEEDLPF